MKKIIFIGVLSAFVSGSALAAAVDGWDDKWGPNTSENAVHGGGVDTASAQVVFKGALPIVSAGEYITITGPGGDPVLNGELELAADGSFGTLVSVVTEVHKYNALSKEVGPKLTDLDAVNVAWTMSTAPVVSAISSDITGSAPVLRFNGADVTTAAGVEIKNGLPSELAAVDWGVRSDSPMANLVSGDEITVTSTVDVTVEF